MSRPSLVKLSEEVQRIRGVLVWTVGNAIKTVVWTRINWCVFGKTNPYTFESALVWTGPKTPSTRSRIFSKTETFFSEYGYRPHVTGVFGHRKRRFSKTLSRVESFENGDSSYSCGRAKTEAFKYDDVMSRLKARSSAHTFENATCGRRKTPRFQKCPATCGWSNTIQKRYVWTQIIF